MGSLLLLLSGFVPLVFGSNFLVNGASTPAKRLRVPPMVIGLTIVAFGTSSPELVVNLVAAAAGNSEISLGNIVGSNIFNVLVIAGLSAVIFPLTARPLQP